MIDLKTNGDYKRQVLKLCKEKEPDLFKRVTERQVLTVLNYVTKNICLSMLKRYDIYIKNFMSIYFNKNIAALKQIRKKNYQDKKRLLKEIEKSIADVQ